MTKLYIDTNIIMYALDDSKNFYGDDISTSSRSLLFAAASCKYYIIVSNWMLKELDLKNKLSQASFLLALLKKKIIDIEKTSEDEELARKQNPDNIQDQLHCILAQKAKADYIVTRNVRDFNHFNKVIPVVKPEKLL